MEKQPRQNPEFIGSNQYGFQPRQGPPPSFAPPGQYPPTQGQISPQRGQYPPQQGQFPRQQDQYGFQPRQGPPPSFAPPGQYPPTQGQISPQQGQYPPQQGQFPRQQGMAPGRPVLVAGATNVIVSGTPCAACKTGAIESEFTCCGICLGICCFPIGLLCCWLMQEKVCTNCQAQY